MNNDLVSIITPCYNSADFIRETIDSILAQTYPNWELLITDDCSTDNTVEIVEQYISKDPRIKLFHMDKNSGAGVCRNKSIEAASGRYIAFCDSDDCWFPEKLEKQLAFMQKQNCALSYSSYMETNEKGVVKGIVVCRSHETLKTMTHIDGIGCLTAIYDTKKVGKVFMPTIRKRQDWGLWLKVLMIDDSAYGLKEPLAWYRVRCNSISRNKFALVKYNVNVYRIILEFSIIKSIFYFGLIFMPNYIMKKLVLKYINK